MRVIVHISDMHFGKIDKKCIGPMLTAFRAIKPHLIIVSGDFTQRARVSEFEAASRFIGRLEHPHLVIPGNHDIRPLYSLQRITNAYDRYKKYISENITPTFVDKEIAVASINTVRRAAVKDGRVSRNQINELAQWFQTHGSRRLKIVVTHHPFSMPAEWSKSKLARRASVAVHTLARAGIDLYLSGHYHQSSVSHTAERYNIDGYAAVSVQAGTVSIRQRRETQSFNIIFASRSTVRIDTYVYTAKKRKFNLRASHVFMHKENSWQSVGTSIK